MYLTKNNLYLSLSLKFIYSEKATKFCKISTVDLTGTIKDKSTVEISQNFVAFLEYINFIKNNLYVGYETPILNEFQYLRLSH